MADAADPTITEDDRTLAEAVLEPTVARGFDNVHFIGPYGARVSFASQQRRALNTVWALEKSGRIQPPARVAVVGAGLSGVTAAVALAARGFWVNIYERNPSALRVQSLTNHRLVHPTINFWPEEPLQPGTEFPFFDWAVGKTDGVIDAIDQEWKELHGKFADRNLIQKTHTNTLVSEVIPEPNGTVTIKTPKYPSRGGNYACVLVTTGFGQEKKLGGTDTVSYWQQENVEDILRDSDLSRFLVSGIGDGGLIDTLRLLHRDFRKGELCLDVAHELDVACVSGELARIEVDVKALTQNPDERALQYHRQLEHFLDASLPDGTRKRLDDSIINDRPDRHVMLVGKLPKPYSVSSAPIHKLLIAHALRRKVLHYEVGSLDQVSGQLTIIHGANIKNTDTEYTIARHGSNVPPEHFIRDDAVRDDLRTRQGRATEWLRTDLVPKRYFDFDGYPPQDPANKEFVARRFDRAELYVLNYAGGTLSRADLKRRPPRFLVEAKPRGTLKPERIPEKLFGIPMEAAPTRKRFKSATSKGVA